MAVNLDGVWHAATELVDGRTAASARLALWAAALSPQNELGNNGRQVERLRPYATGGLPHDERALRALIGGTQLTHSKLQAVIRIDEQAASGALDWVLYEPTTVRGWLAWRVRVAHLYGLSWKTASFAALLLWPFDCPFVPVDTHVCRRFGLSDQSTRISGKSHPAYLRYRSIERRVYNEWRDAGKPCPIALWHWLKWDTQRASADVESHAALSPYAY